jgi:hypothetical protein
MTERGPLDPFEVVADLECGLMHDSGPAGDAAGIADFDI